MHVGVKTTGHYRQGKTHVQIQRPINKKIIPFVQLKKKV